MGTRKKGVEFAKHITEIITKSTGFESHLQKVRSLNTPTAAPLSNLLLHPF